MNELESIDLLTRDLYAAISFAHRFSTYQTRFQAGDSEAVVLGINSIQFIKTKGVWRVVSIVWNDQKKNQPLPEKYQ